jgi:hypothetical protein
MLRSLIPFAAALVLAVAGLAFLQTGKIDAETLTLGPQNQATFETWNGQRITGSRLSDIEALLMETASNRSPDQKVLLWLGNSQLHAINQYKQGDHLAPYWMAQSANCNKCLIPMGSKSKLVRMPLPADDPKQRKPDITKAKNVLGWEPKVQLEDGLKETISYFRSLLA